MNQSLEKYLTAVDRHLKPLPVSERADIVKEIKSTMLEMESEQMSFKQILDRLGSPKDLAKAYLKDLLVKEKRCSVKRFLILWAFYTAAGFSGMVVIPVLAVIAPVFLLCGIAAPVLSAVKMFDYLLNLRIPFIQNMQIAFYGIINLNPVAEFFCSGIGGYFRQYSCKGCLSCTIIANNNSRVSDSGLFKNSSKHRISCILPFFIFTYILFTLIIMVLGEIEGRIIIYTKLIHTKR